MNLIKDYKQAVFSKSLGEVWSDLPHLSSKFDKYYSELKQTFGDRDPDNMTVQQLLDKYYSELKLTFGDRDPDNMTVQQLLENAPQLTKEIALLFAGMTREFIDFIAYTN